MPRTQWDFTKRRLQTCSTCCFNDSISNWYICEKWAQNYSEFKPKDIHWKCLKHKLLSSWVTWGIVSDSHTWADCSTEFHFHFLLYPIFSSNSGKCNYFPNRSHLVSWQGSRHGLDSTGASCSRARNTTPQTKCKNTIASPRYTQTPKHTWLQRRTGDRSEHALLASKLKSLFWHSDAEIFVSPFFYHSNSP